MLTTDSHRFPDGHEIRMTADESNQPGEIEREAKIRESKMNWATGRSVRWIVWPRARLPKLNYAVESISVLRPSFLLVIFILSDRRAIV